MTRYAAGFVLLVGLVGLVVAGGCETGPGGDFAIRFATLTPDGFIPEKYTGDGADVSPPIEFLHVPEGTVELALLVDDPDAPSPEPWVHWVVYGIPPDTDALPEGFRAAEGGPIREGRNSWASGKTVGWRGPTPPSGTHRYIFRALALREKVPLPRGATKEQLLAATEGFTIARAELVGKYSAKN